MSLFDGNLSLRRDYMLSMSDGVISPTGKALILSGKTLVESLRKDF